MNLTTDSDSEEYEKPWFPPQKLVLSLSEDEKASAKKLFDFTTREGQFVIFNSMVRVTRDETGEARFQHRPWLEDIDCIPWVDTSRGYGKEFAHFDLHENGEYPTKTMWIHPYAQNDNDTIDSEDTIVVDSSDWSYSEILHYISPLSSDNAEHAENEFPARQLFGNPTFRTCGRCYIVNKAKETSL